MESPGQSTQPSTSNSAKLLGRPWWQAVGAIIGLIGVIVTVIIYVLQTASSKPDGGTDIRSGSGNVQAGSGNVQAESGNCVIQGGTGNNCQVAPPLPTPAADPLAVNPGWPTIRNCDGSTLTAMLKGGLTPDLVPPSSTEDFRTTMVNKGGASFGTGHLYLTMTVVDDSTVQIEEIKPLFFRTTPMLPAWVYDSLGGCGGDSYSRVFDLNLDRKTFTDQGSPTDEPGDPLPNTRREPLGPSFHVERDDPAEVRIDASACDAAYYEWGLRIKYVAEGRTFTKEIGSPAEPFRSIGSGGSRVSAYTLASATELKKSEPVASECD